MKYTEDNVRGVQFKSPGETEVFTIDKHPRDGTKVRISWDGRNTNDSFSIRNAVMNLNSGAWKGINPKRTIKDYLEAKK